MLPSEHGSIRYRNLTVVFHITVAAPLGHPPVHPFQQRHEPSYRHPVGVPVQVGPVDRQERRVNVRVVPGGPLEYP